MRAGGIKRKKLRGLYKMLSIEKNLENFFFLFFFYSAESVSGFPVSNGFYFVTASLF